ncbi:hypothetical protein ACFO3D_03195 [Virgibacillus kekensis]|uniref:Uncharacterized protein n=1 Tax=Virgibacillus kekensis TaxID=202261 RepID=A0ABV9DFP9_9BACI
MNILEAANRNELNLVEVSILLELEKHYPRPVKVEEVNKDELVRENIHNLIQKGLVEQRWDKYRIVKNVPAN